MLYDRAIHKNIYSLSCLETCLLGRFEAQQKYSFLAAPEEPQHVFVVQHSKVAMTFVSFHWPPTKTCLYCIMYGRLNLTLNPMKFSWLKLTYVLLKYEKGIK
ncbi:CLUMA_CG014136, isoform A [Clunio marinus]|uniref:CLUMA_CG014136, isoform A n=1 Tax=Clunio marinus TaxID=568069 RepID=A0A1J1IKX3_9DIPT|nr:CLUMA_CG014136, isoform A [Clunio marinus]